MDIDLGEEVIFKVKLGAKSYELREPTLKDVKAMQKSKDQEGAFVDLIVNLGLPKDVADNLGMLKLKKLSEGLMAPLQEKK